MKIGATTVRSYTYDYAGQPAAMTDATGTTSIVWDDDARMTSLTPPSSSALTNAYNAFGTRVSAGSSSLVRDGAGVTAPVLRDAGASYTPGIMERRGSTDRFLTSDLRSVDSLTNSTGSGSGKRTYDAFGRIDTSSGTWSGPSGFGGKYGYQEDANGLKLLGNRWYDAEVGRFLTRDPAKQGRNWYTYCNNDPVGNVDPLGLGDTSLDGNAGEAELYRDLITEDNIDVDFHGAGQPPAPEPVPEPTPETNLSPDDNVYRGATHGNENHLTPRGTDSDGLSMRTKPLPGRNNVVFKVKDLLDAGFHVINDHSLHVAVSPVAAKMIEWIEAGPGSEWRRKLMDIASKLVCSIQ
ncbi:hypothetical protein BH11ARM2_BH11ARM2_24520 [soil metagenome]